MRICTCFRNYVGRFIFFEGVDSLCGYCFTSCKVQCTVSLRSKSAGTWIAAVPGHLCIRGAWIAHPGNMYNLFEILGKHGRKWNRIQFDEVLLLHLCVLHRNLKILSVTLSIVFLFHVNFVLQDTKWRVLIFNLLSCPTCL